MGLSPSRIRSEHYFLDLDIKRTYHEPSGIRIKRAAMNETSACRNDARRRDANGRFVPGQSGNPAGKKPGTRNGATVLREALADGEGVAAARIVIDKALAGNGVAARFIIDRLEPRPRGRAVTLDLPVGASAGAVGAAYDTTLRALASGEITPDEALAGTRRLHGRVGALTR